MFTAAKNHKTEETLMKEGGLKISRSVTNLCSHIVCCVCLYIQTRQQREHRIWVIYKRMFVLFLALCAMYIKWAHPGGVFNSKRVCGSAGWLSKRAEGGSAEATAQLAPFLIIGAVAKFDTCSNGGKNFDGASRIYWRRASHFWAQFMSLSVLLIGIFKRSNSNWHMRAFDEMKWEEDLICRN
jgi:hypothetical protein